MARRRHVFTGVHLLIAVLLTLADRAMAAPQTVPFTLPDSTTFSVSLVLPESASITDRKKTQNTDLIQARIDDSSTAGLLVEIRNSKGEILWSHDFGYNSSASEGNKIQVSYDPQTRLLLIGYDGYKWDHAHKLFTIDQEKSLLSVREYTTADKDILPLLKRQKDFAYDYTYWIYPLRLIDRGVEFECIPFKMAAKKSVHPFAQDQQWYIVTVIVDAKGNITPTGIKPEH